MRISRVFALCLIGLGFPQHLAAATFLVFSSQPGDYIGQGENHVWTTADGTFSAAINTHGANSEIRFDGGASTNWTVWFAAPNGATLTPGTYEDAERHPFQSPTKPGMWIFGSGRGCNTISGRFVVHEIVLGLGNTIQSFAADFEQHCETGGPALFGAIRFNSDVAYASRVLSSAGANLITRRAFDGAMWAVRIEGDRITDGARLTLGLPAGWTAVGMGDFDADRQADLVFQRQSDGAIAVWILNGRIVKHAVLLPYVVPDTGWRIVAVGDLNGDGNGDLIWQHVTAGWVSVWYMRGLSRISGELLQPGRVDDTAWRIVGAADMDQDGQTDLLWRHLSQGWVAVWRLRGARLLSGELLHQMPVDLTWRLKGATDVNNDGEPDLIWEGTEGEVYPAPQPRRVYAVWVMRGLRLTDGRLLTPPSIDNFSDHWDVLTVR